MSIGTATGRIDMDVASAESKLQSFEGSLRSVDKTASGLTGLSNWAQENEQHLNTLGKAYTGAGATILSAFAGPVAVGAKAAWDQVDAVQQGGFALRAYEKDASKVDAVMAGLLDYAKSERSGGLFFTDELLAAASNMKVYGAETENLTGYTEILSRAVGLGTAEWSFLNTVIGRTGATGKLTSGDFDNLTRMGFQLDESIRGTSISWEELFEHLDKGIPEDALLGQADTIRGRMAWLQGALLDVGSAFLGVNAATGEFIEGGLGDQLFDGLKRAREMLLAMVPTIQMVGNVVGRVAGLMSKLIDAFLALPTPIQTAIITGIGLTGVLLTMSGLMLLMVPRALAVASAMRAIGGVSGVMTRLAKVIPGVSRAMAALSGGFSRFIPMIGRMFTLRGLTSIFTSFGSVLMSVGRMFLGIIPRLAMFATRLVMMHPILAALGLAFAAFRGNWFGFRDAVMGALEPIINAVDAFKVSWQGLIQTRGKIGAFFGSISAALRSFDIGILDSLATKLDGIVKGIGGFWDAMTGGGGGEDATITRNVETKISGDDKLIEWVENPEAFDGTGFDYMVRMKNPDGSFDEFGQIMESYTDESDPNIAHIKIKTDEGEYWTTVDKTTGEIGDGTITVDADASKAEKKTASFLGRLSKGLREVEEHFGDVGLDFFAELAGSIADTIDVVDELYGVFSDTWDDMSQGENAVNWLSRAFLSMNAAILAFTGGDLSGWLGRVYNGFQTAAIIVQELVGHFQDLRDRGLDPVQSALVAIGLTFEPLYDSMVQLAGVVRDLIGAFDAFMDGDYGRGFDLLEDAASGLWDVFENIPWSDIGQLLVDGLQTAAQSAWNWLNTEFEPFLRSAVTTGWNWLDGRGSELMGSLWESMLSAAQRVWDWLNGSFETWLRSAVTTGWNWFDPRAEELMANMWTAMLSGAQRVWDWLNGSFETWLRGAVTTGWDWFDPRAEELMANLWTAMLAGAQRVWDWLNGSFETWLRSAVQRGWDWLSPHGAELMGSLWESLLSGGQDVWNWLNSDFETWLRSAVEGAWDWLLDKGRELMDSAVDGFERGWSSIVNWLNTLPNRVSGLTLISGAWDWLLDKGRELLQSAVDGFERGWSSVVNWLGTLSNRISGLTLIGGVWDFLIDQGRELLMSAVTGFNRGWTSVVNWLATLARRIAGLAIASGAWDFLIAKGKELLDGAAEGFERGWVTVRGWLETLPGKIKGLALSFNPIEWLYDVGTDIIRGIADGISAAWGYVVDAWNARPTWLGGTGGSDDAIKAQYDIDFGSIGADVEQGIADATADQDGDVLGSAISDLIVKGVGRAASAGVEQNLLIGEGIANMVSRAAREAMGQNLGEEIGAAIGKWITRGLIVAETSADLTTGVTSLVNGLTDAVSESLGGDEGGSIATAMGNAFQGGVEAAAEKMQVITGMMADIPAAWVTILNTVWAGPFQTAVAGTFNSVLGVWRSELQTMSVILTAQASAWDAIMDQWAGDIQSIVAGTWSAIVTTWREQLQTMTMILTAQSGAWDAIMDRWAGNIQSTVASAMADVVSTFRDQLQTITVIITTQSNGWPVIVGRAIDRIAGVITSRGWAAISAAQTLGQDIGRGLARGMEQMLSRIRTAANNMVDEANRAARARALAESPSRLFMILGGDLTQGAAIGIERMLPLMVKAGEKLVDTVTRVLKSATPAEMDFGGLVDRAAALMRKTGGNARGHLADVISQGEWGGDMILDMGDQFRDEARALGREMEDALRGGTWNGQSGYNAMDPKKVMAFLEQLERAGHEIGGIVEGQWRQIGERSSDWINTVTGEMRRALAPHTAPASFWRKPPTGDPDDWMKLSDAVQGGLTQSAADAQAAWDRMMSTTTPIATADGRTPFATVTDNRTYEFNISSNNPEEVWRYVSARLDEEYDMAEDI